MSRNLIKGTPDSGQGGWRLPAPEIERTVAAAACTILGDQAALANAALAIGLAEHRLPSLSSLAAAWMKRLQSDVEVGAVLSTLVERVDLIDSGIRVALKVSVPISAAGHPSVSATELVLTQVFPIRIGRRGFEMRLIIEGSGALVRPT